MQSKGMQNTEKILKFVVVLEKISVNIYSIRARFSYDLDVVILGV